MTFDLHIWAWDWSITILMLWKKIAKIIILWCHVTQKPHLVCLYGDHPSDRYFSKKHFATNKVMAQKVMFMVCDVFDLDLWHFKVIWYLKIHHLFPCMTGVNFDAICSSIAEIYHIEIWKNSLCFIMFFFRCHENVCYVFRIDAFFCKVPRIGPSNMYIKIINFEKNRLKIGENLTIWEDDFHFS